MWPRAWNTDLGGRVRVLGHKGVRLQNLPALSLPWRFPHSCGRYLHLPRPETAQRGIFNREFWGVVVDPGESAQPQADGARWPVTQALAARSKVRIAFARWSPLPPVCREARLGSHVTSSGLAPLFCDPGRGRPPPAPLGSRGGALTGPARWPLGDSPPHVSHGTRA